MKIKNIILLILCPWKWEDFGFGDIDPTPWKEIVDKAMEEINNKNSIGL